MTGSRSTPPTGGWRAWRWSALAAGAVALALVAWRAANLPASGQSDAPPPSRVASDSGELTVVLSPDALAHAGIVSVPLPASAYRQTVTAYGSVVDVDSLAAAHATIASARAAATRAAAVADAAQQELARIRTLHADSENASTRALQAAEAASRGAAAEAGAARAAARAQEAMMRQRWGQVLGGGTTAGRSLVGRLLAHRAVLLLVALPAGEVVGSPPARIVVQGAGAPAEARFVSRAMRTDPRTQGEAFFYAAPAGPGLPAGLNVTAELPVGAPRRTVIVPRSAVVWAEGGAWVYIQTARATYARRAISTGEPARRGYVEAQLAPGTRVVVRGAQTLLSEEFRSHAQPVSGDDDG